jgi:hypothetical protein
MGKKFNPAKLLAVAKRYKPLGVRVRFKRGKKLGPAYAIILPNGEREILSPRPVTREGLFYFLHECGHLVLRHWHVDIPVWQQEYEAELWAMATMRREGIPVSIQSIRDAKEYVRGIVVAHIEKGLPKPPVRVLRWCGYLASEG